MRHLKLLGLTLLAVFASAMAVTSSAFAALPVNLPVSGAARAWTGKNTSGILELLQPGQETVVCKSAASTGEEEAGKPLGPMHIEFKECKTKNTLVTCTGLGDAAGIILTLGTWHLVFDQLTPTLLSALLLLIENVHFNCSALVLVEVLGELLCLHLNPTVNSTTHEFHCTEIAGPKQEDETYFDDNGVAVNNVHLLCSVNHASEVPCYELALGSVTYGVSIFADI